MAQDKTAPDAAPVPEALPQVGGSYTRQPDGSLLPNAPAPAETLPTDTPLE
jgi:hypothetical protein